MWYEEMYNLVCVKRVDFDTDNKFRASLQYIQQNDTSHYISWYQIRVFLAVLICLPIRNTAISYSENTANVTGLTLGESRELLGSEGGNCDKLVGLIGLLGLLGSVGGNCDILAGFIGLFGSDGGNNAS